MPKGLLKIYVIMQCYWVYMCRCCHIFVLDVLIIAGEIYKIDALVRIRWLICCFAHNFFLIVKSPCATGTYVSGRETYKLDGKYSDICI